MFCPSCGAQNEDGTKFCTMCGKSFPKQAPPMAQPTPPMQEPPPAEAAKAAGGGGLHNTIAVAAAFLLCGVLSLPIHDVFSIAVLPYLLRFAVIYAIVYFIAKGIFSARDGK